MPAGDLYFFIRMSIPAIFRTTWLLLLLYSGIRANAQNISTVAGNGSAGFSGDGGPATSGRLNYAQDVALDTFGNIYIADAFNQRVRKITATTGIISTIAGTGVAGYSGDGGDATLAQLNAPIGIATDLSGNVYICDNGNHRIRKISVATGIITTIAGDGTPGASGDGDPATDARIYGPYDIAVDHEDNVYIADVSNNKIRKITASTGIMTTVAGTGAPGFSGDGGAATSARLFQPFSVAVDGSGNLYIADASNYRVRKVTAATGNISTIAGNGSAGASGDGGLATAARFNTPYSIAVNRSGDLFISDFNNSKIRKVTAATGIVSTVAGTGTSGYTGDGGPAVSARLGEPRGLFLDQSGNLYLADYLNSAIRFICFSVAVPGAPLVRSPVTRCTGSSPAALTAIGTNLKWYTTASGGSGSTTAPIPATVSTGTATWYVSQSSSCGESPRSAIVVHIIDAPAAPAVSSPLFYCSGIIAPPLHATGTDLKWYDSPGGDTGTSTAPVPATEKAGTTLYYVSQGPAGCESPRALITVTVHSTPEPPLSTDTALYYCEGAAATALRATGTDLKWYLAPEGGIPSTAAPTPSTSAEGIRTYYVSQTAASGCESPRTAIQVRTSKRPETDITASTTPLFFYCKGSDLLLQSLTRPYGIFYRWQLESADITGADKDSLRVSRPGRYSVIVSNGTDCADTASVIVVQDSSFLRTSLFPKDVMICEGVRIKLYASPATGSGLSYTWTRNGSLLPGAGGAELEAGEAGSYTVLITNAMGCTFSSEPALLHTYAAVPKPRINRAGSVLSIPPGYSNYQWYRNKKAIPAADARLFNLVFDGEYYVRVTDENGCINYSDTVTITALGVPGADMLDDILLYPLPAREEVYIRGPILPDVQVFDLTGKLMGDYKEAALIRTAAWPDGIYFFVLRDREGALLAVRKVQKLSK